MEPFTPNSERFAAQRMFFSWEHTVIVSVQMHSEPPSGRGTPLVAEHPARSSPGAQARGSAGEGRRAEGAAGTVLLEHASGVPSRDRQSYRPGALQQRSSRISVYAGKENQATGAIPQFISTLS